MHLSEHKVVHGQNRLVTENSRYDNSQGAHNAKSIPWFRDPEKCLVQTKWTGVQRKDLSQVKLLQQFYQKSLCEIVTTTNVTYETYNRRQSDTMQNNNKLTAKTHCHLRFNNSNKMIIKSSNTTLKAFVKGVSWYFDF